MKSLLILLSFVYIINANELVFSSGKHNILHKISSEVLSKAYANIGIKTKFIYGNFEKSLTLSNGGLIDGEVARLKKLNKKYTNLLLIPVPINHMDAVAFGKNTFIHISKWEDLKNYNVGIVEGTKCIEDGTSCLVTSKYKGFDELFKALNNGKIDIAIAPKISGLYIIHLYNYNNIHLISQSLDHVKMYHFLHKKNSSIVPRITQALKSMEKNNELRDIRNSYLKQMER